MAKFHYRDDYGVEVDAIVQLRDGRWGAIEIKLGPGQVEAAFLAVVCGSGYGYRRADGIAVDELLLGSIAAEIQAEIPGAEVRLVGVPFALRRDGCPGLEAGPSPPADRAVALLRQ
ncbi:MULTISPECIES: DUF4143 domain-containing protein [Synechococcales]|uniref:DUF4143 domain-containing protein n=1 Tax=Synechococcus sp. CS-1324 TaxID=2847980 RepID=UPI00223C3A91|nr:DUF4143 domain-containing protein [Synechococcus sp. CS-1324]